MEPAYKYTNALYALDRASTIQALAAQAFVPDLDFCASWGGGANVFHETLAESVSDLLAAAPEAVYAKLGGPEFIVACEDSATFQALCAEVRAAVVADPISISVEPTDIEGADYRVTGLDVTGRPGPWLVRWTKGQVVALVPAAAGGVGYEEVVAFKGRAAGPGWTDRFEELAEMAVLVWRRVERVVGAERTLIAA